MTSGNRAPQASPVPEPATVPAIPVRIAELTRRRTGVAEQIVVRLDPPELGTVRITVTARGDNVHVALRADNPAARAALAAQRETIETLLSGEGFDLSSFDVGHQRQGGGQPNSRPRGNGARFTMGFESTEPAAPSTVAADGALRL
jgi:flagellar hook-length control protein FliK